MLNKIREIMKSKIEQADKWLSIYNIKIQSNLDHNSEEIRFLERHAENRNKSVELF